MKEAEEGALLLTTYSFCVRARSAPTYALTPLIDPRGLGSRLPWSGARLG